MRERDFGRIVNMASIYGPRATINRVDYVTTKTAMIGFTRAVALETAAQNITCNAICPGSSPTPSIEQRFADFMAKANLPRAEAEKAFMGSRQPSGRFVSPDRIADLVAFLCGPDGADTPARPFQSTVVGAQRSLFSPTKRRRRHDRITPTNSCPLPPRPCREHVRRTGDRAGSADHQVAPDVELSEEPRHAVRRGATRSPASSAR